MLVYLNPGHDRELDSGAINTHSGIRECDKAYELGCKVKDCLEARGVSVRLGQDDNLYAVCDEANDCDADIFVSIHFNGFNGLATGTETLISSSAASLILGHCIQSRMKTVLGLADRGLKERAGLLVLRSTVMPAVLLEVCFIDNDRDMARYNGREDKMAAAIADGIQNYFQQSNIA
jgi:N-acetylmuramoyl-L-alanine amidase